MRISIKMKSFAGIEPTWCTPVQAQSLCERKMPFGPRPDHRMIRINWTRGGNSEGKMQCQSLAYSANPQTHDRNWSCAIQVFRLIHYFEHLSPFPFSPLPNLIWPLWMGDFPCSERHAEDQANFRYRITGYFNSSAEFVFLSFTSVLFCLTSSGLTSERRVLFRHENVSLYWVSSDAIYIHRHITLNVFNKLDDRDEFMFMVGTVGLLKIWSWPCGGRIAHRCEHPSALNDCCHPFVKFQVVWKCDVIMTWSCAEQASQRTAARAQYPSEFRCANPLSYWH